MHPIIGSWPCNPPKEFYELRKSDMGGTSPNHMPNWKQTYNTGDLSLPVCTGADAIMP